MSILDWFIFGFIIKILEFQYYNPGQNIDDTFPNIVIFLAHCYYKEKTSPPQSMLFCCFHFLQIQHYFGGEGVNWGAY